MRHKLVHLNSASFNQLGDFGQKNIFWATFLRTPKLSPRVSLAFESSPPSKQISTNFGENFRLGNEIRVRMNGD